MAITTRAVAPPLPARGLTFVREAIYAPPLDREERRVEATALWLERSEHAGELMRYIVDHHIEIAVLPRGVYREQYPGSGAHFDPKRNRIRMPSSLAYAGELPTTLAHEAKHAYDFGQGPPWYVDVYQVIGGSAKDGVKALVSGGNPLSAWLDSITARMNEDEVAAYEIQAQVANELGRNESRWAHGQAPDGSVLPKDEIRASIAIDDLYRMSPLKRLGLGASLGFIVTATGAAGVQMLASKMRPTSYLASHGWPAYAIGGVMSAAWLVSDQIRARRLEESSAPYNGR